MSGTILDETTPMGDLHSHPPIRALYCPGLLLRTLIFRNYVQKQVHFYTLFQESPDTLDLGQTGHFTRTSKNAFVRFWEADLKAGWGITGPNEKKGCFGG